jgi:DNA-binding MarR family transcriptional regulator
MPAAPDKERDRAAVDDIARNCLAVRLRKLNRVVSGVYDDALRPLGIKVSQMNILVVAEKLGLARPAELCRLLDLDVSTLSRNVERMRAKGWLETVAEKDARLHPCRVTRKGRKLLAEAYPAWQAAQKRAAKILGGEGVAFLRESAAVGSRQAD